jgi:ribosomal protein S18 acetylase RimI-like enzyme
MAAESDIVALAQFADIATRGLMSFVWGQMAHPGQSSLEVGQNIIRSVEANTSHFKNWCIGDCEGRPVCAINSYHLTEAVFNPVDLDVFRPLNALKARVLGAWYISNVAVYAEYRGNRFGTALLTEAENAARSARICRLALTVGSFNRNAYDLYRKYGFSEYARQPLLPVPGTDDTGEWVLMIKDLS